MYFSFHPLYFLKNSVIVFFISICLCLYFLSNSLLNFSLFSLILLLCLLASLWSLSWALYQIDFLFPLVYYFSEVGISPPPPSPPIPLKLIPLSPHFAELFVFTAYIRQISFSFFLFSFLISEVSLYKKYSVRPSNILPSGYRVLCFKCPSRFSACGEADYYACGDRWG